MTETLNSKDALFALDTTMEEDMAGYRDETTNLVIKHINSTPELYKLVSGAKTDAELRRYCYGWAESHGNEFGELFQTELDVVKWGEVRKRV